MSTTQTPATPTNTEQQIIAISAEVAPIAETAATLAGQPEAAAVIAALEQLVAQSIAALASAKGQPVTAADVLALLPAPIVLDAPAGATAGE